jgi:uncharacterized iron-regulated protein
MSASPKRAIPFLFLLAIVAASGCSAATGAGRPGPEPRQPEYRIYDTTLEAFIDLQSLAQNVAAADVAFFGEFHDDVVAQRLQRRLLEELGTIRGELALGLEMFERDVQHVIDLYTGGRISEAEFLVAARPWANYREAYRPLVELARRQGWPVAATNLPRPVASRIAADGLAALEDLPPRERADAARELHCPRDEYWDRFVHVFTAGTVRSPHGHSTPEALWTMYQAQCARDETMAEGVAALLQENDFVLHVNGAFHTDFQLGIVQRLLRRRPHTRVAVISALPVPDVSDPPLDENLFRADYLIFTPQLRSLGDARFHVLEP